MIKLENGSREFYDLWADSLEFNNLMGSLTAEQQMIRSDLEAEATQIRSAWSCRDHIKNGDEEGIDCGGSFCADCTTSTNDLLNKEKIKVFPNPTDGQLNFQSENIVMESIEIFYSIGQLVLTKSNINSTNINLEIGHLSNQIYFAKITTAQGIEKIRFVKL